MNWPFPLSRSYTGILLGNGSMGIMVWGTEDVRLTIGRTGFWDRRGGIPFSAQTDYAALRGILEAGDADKLKAAFSNPAAELPYRTPTQLPGGRLDVSFGARPTRGELNPSCGILTLHLANGRRVEIRQSMTRDLAWIGGDAGAVGLLPSWRWLGDLLGRGGVRAPEEWGDECGGGFVQSLPDDPGLAVAWRRVVGGILLATSVGPDPRAQAEELLDGPGLMDEEEESWWAAYRADLPAVRLPDPALQRAWDYGVFKQAGMTPPGGLPATLQGPWMAESELPPWSNDYHFNINLQMIYWPALPTNRASHYHPLWKMLMGWLPKLRENAAAFFKNPRALMLPHAVDDECHVIGNFWQGTIDQACTAWMAQLAWLHYRHTMDKAVLQEVAWPLLVGAFEGFWSMAEEASPGCLSLPVSVSAEFGGWGRDASFQLAAFHMVAQILPKAAAILGEASDPRWESIHAELPPYTTMPLAKVWGEKELRPRIVLWECQDLTESHRHHSHLAAISPFGTIDPADLAHRDVVRRSMEHWAAMGSGQWVGWSMPWAAMIWARCNYASAAVSILRIWEDIFTNCGGQTLHNADTPGYSSWVHGPFFDWPESQRNEDQMQMDAGFGALQAIVEIFVQQRGDSLYILPSLPKQWRDFSFDGILCEGAFLAGATVEGGQLREVRITSQVGGILRIAFPAPLMHGAVRASAFTLETTSGDSLVFVADLTDDAPVPSSTPTA